MQTQRLDKSSKTRPKCEPTLKKQKPVSKQAKLIRLLSRPAGSTIRQLEQGLGWQAHTVRAAICRLRKTGTAIETGKSKQGNTNYRMTVANMTDARQS